MITNLFSRFDPLSSMWNLPLNWVSTWLGIFFFPLLYWLIPSRWTSLLNNVILSLHKEFKMLLGRANPGRTIILIRLFYIIVFNNSLGLFPYIFTSSRHLTITLRLSLPLWISFIIYGWTNHTQHMFAHLIPAGTPGPLMPFIVLIETVRNIIRPGTLAVRLAANIIAGHLLLTLLGNTGPSLTSILLWLLILSQILLLILESAVAVIQSYVFTALRTLYAGEVNH